MAWDYTVILEILVPSPDDVVAIVSLSKERYSDCSSLPNSIGYLVVLGKLDPHENLLH